MDRRYYRKYENFDTVVPRVEDFPILNSDNRISEVSNEATVKYASDDVKTDELILLVVLIVLLMEEEKDMSAILSVAALLFAGYIF